MKEFPHKHWSKWTLNRLIKQIDTTGSADKKKNPGRKRNIRTAPNVNAVEELVLSQEEAPGTHRSTRQIAREAGISQRSVLRIIHKDLKLKCFKRKRAQELTEANKLTRLTRAKQLLNKYPESLVNSIWFTDEKFFTVAAPVNLQNNRLYANQGTQKRQLPAARLLKTRSTFHSQLWCRLESPH